MRKYVLILSLFSLLAIESCGPKVKSEADQETKTDSLDLQEGKGEGPVPEEIIK